MADMSPADRLNRHALVMALWTPAAFVAAVLLNHGMSTGTSSWWIAAGFAAIAVGFVGHVIVNAVLGTRFTAGETALGATVFAAALAATLLAALVGPDGFGARFLLPVGAGLAGLLATVLIYMVIAFGPRRAFEKFDVIRDNNLRAASRLPHRGGRR